MPPPSPEEFANITPGMILLDVEFTYTHPVTGIPTRGFIRIEVSQSAVYADVTAAVEDFLTEFAGRYPGRHTPVAAGIRVISGFAGPPV